MSDRASEALAERNICSKLVGRDMTKEAPSVDKLPSPDIANQSVRQSLIYKALGTKEIRLLSILPARQNAPVLCRVQNVALGDYSIHHLADLGKTEVCRCRDGSKWFQESGNENGNADGSTETQYTWIPPVGSETTSTANIVPVNSESEVEVPRFEALSYNWGDPTKSKSILIDPHPFDVGENLYDALIHLRNEHIERVFWIDAICINQNDNMEKLDQIKIMRDIYQRAWRTIVWLGASSPAIDYAITLLEKLGGQVASWGPHIPSGEFWGPQYDRYDGIGQLVMTAEQKEFKNYWKSHAKPSDVVSPLRFGEKEWDAFDKLLRLPWWTRVWIVQEVANSQSLFLQSGSRIFSW